MSSRHRAAPKEAAVIHESWPPRLVVVLTRLATLDKEPSTLEADECLVDGVGDEVNFMAIMAENQQGGFEAMGLVPEDLRMLRKLSALLRPLGCDTSPCRKNVALTLERRWADVPLALDPSWNGVLPPHPPLDPRWKEIQPLAAALLAAVRRRSDE